MKQVLKNYIASIDNNDDFDSDKNNYKSNNTSKLKVYHN